MAVTGSLQIKNGKYYVVLNLKDKNNKRKQKWINTGFDVKGNKKKAEKFLQEQIVLYSESKENKQNSILFVDYLNIWLDSIKGAIRRNSYRSYEGNIRNHVIPYFEPKGYALSDITPIMLEDYFRQMKKEGLSDTTIRHHRENLSKAFNDAIHDNIILNNPVHTAKPPRTTKKFHATFLTPNELDILMVLVKGTVIELPVKLCAIYGFRRSEVLGLKWQHISFENKTITIDETLQQFPGGDYTDDPKTDESRRVLPINGLGMSLLQEQKEQQERYASIMGDSYVHTDYVCTWPDGHVISPNYLTKNFHKVLKESNLPMVRLHDLRHSVASNLLKQGMSIPSVSSWIGHSSPSTTLKFYAHSNFEDKKAIGSMMDQMIKIV